MTTMTTVRRGHPRGASPPAWKFEAPRLTEHVIARVRLCEKIEQHLGRQRSSGDVLLVSAPAGYGKTTMLAQWAAKSSVPVAWYHLDGGDDDPVTFTFGIVRALREALPIRNRARGRWSVKDLVENLRGGALSPLDLRRAKELLAADIRLHINQPIALILTGVDQLTSKSGAHQILDGLLGRVPDFLRIVLEAREIPALRLSPLLPAGRLQGLGLEDLQLIDEELVGLLERIGVSTEAGYIRQLQELCAGWVMGVMLATGALWPTCLALRASDQLNRDAVFAYLASEVIDHLPLTLSDFATRVAVLSYMTEPLCNRFFGTQDARVHLAALEQQTGFVTHVGRRPQEPIFRFQPLLRQVLLDHLTRDVADEQELRALHLHAGACLEELDDLEEAVQQYARAGAFERVVTLIERQKGFLLRSGRGATLVRWLDLLPDTVRAQHPVLQILLAELHQVSGRTAEAYTAIQCVCSQVLPRADGPSAIVAKALVVRANVHYTRGEYAAAREDCEVALRLAPDDADELRVETLFTLAVSSSILIGPEAAAEYLAEAEARCERMGDLWALARLHYVRSNLAISRGALVEAERAAAAGLLCAQEANDEVRAIVCRLNLGAIRQFLGQAATARADLEGALAQAEAAGHVQAQAYALVNFGDLELTNGNFAAALDWYERAEHSLAGIQDQHLQVCIAAGTGYALARQGRADAAHARLTRAQDVISPDGKGADWLQLTIALGVACYHSGELAPAEAQLGQAIDYARSNGIRMELVQALLALSATRLAQGRSADAQDLLLDALEIGAQVDGTPTLLLEARHYPPLWPALRDLNHPLANALLAMLMEEHRDGTIDESHTDGAALVDSELPPIQVRMFGGACVQVGGETVTRWRRPRMRELLFFLLDRDEPVRSDVIMDAIWPDKPPEKAESEFRKARSELQKALGRSCLRQQNGYWHFTAPCRVDVREFHRLAAEGEQLAVDGHLSGACAALREALDCYSGPYLDEIFNDWAVLRREALHMHYLEVLQHLADLEMEMRQYDQAARHYYRILELEEFSEAAHRGLMRYFAARGEYARAIAQFQTCTQILQAGIGASPAPQTIALYQSVLARLQASSRAVAANRAAAS